MLNTVILQGRLTGDVEVKIMNNQKQTKYANFSIAVQKSKDEAMFVPVKAFGETAENIAKYFKKGNGILINISQYEKDGQKTSFTAVVVTSFDFPIGNPKENAQNENVPF